MSSNGDGGTSANHTGPIRSRIEAIARLSEAAQYFSDSEPHSPVAYLVRRAIRWADMDFADVLGELVKDDKLVKQIGETLGIASGPASK
jgi:type VI secretion system protein ImpA